MRRILLSTLAAVTLGGTLGGCYAHDDSRDREYRHENRDRHVYIDRSGREYRHARWHDEDVWQREDGRWYTRNNNDWILRADVDIH
ncbi:MAG TPA: hypothetical protein VGH20_17350 [Myxococcales bacterium]|jgi:hypothetical protein